jgi:hypothetical protein
LGEPNPDHITNLLRVFKDSNVHIDLTSTLSSAHETTTVTTPAVSKSTQKDVDDVITSYRRAFFDMSLPFHDICITNIYPPFNSQRIFVRQLKFGFQLRNLQKDLETFFIENLKNRFRHFFLLF